MSLRAKRESLQPIKLEPTQKIAFILSPRLGDSLLSMIVVHNLVRHGYQLTVFSDYLQPLQAWFPWVEILPRPAPAVAKTTLQCYDLVLQAFIADTLPEAQIEPARLKILEHSRYNWQQKPMVDIQIDFCRYVFSLQDVVRENGIQVPAHLKHRHHLRRVVIHPTSYELQKNWLPKRFMRLADQLQKRDYQPAFIVSPAERPTWLQQVATPELLPAFASLAEVAAWIYESGWFIGNDSGIGHLASNLGIPTITLGMRPKMLQRWRPAWAPGIVLLPPSWLIGPWLKRKLWKYFISVSRVLTAFKQLQIYKPS